MVQHACLLTTLAVAAVVVVAVPVVAAAVLVAVVVVVIRAVAAVAIGVCSSGSSCGRGCKRCAFMHGHFLASDSRSMCHCSTP